MEQNNTYNLMNQITQESKSLWRIKNTYEKEATSDELKAFWLKLAGEKEASIAMMKEFLKSELQ
jgi:hypothetical protein